MPKRFKPVVNDTTVYVQGRIAYEHLLQPYAKDEKDEKKYSCTVILDKGDTESAAAFEKATQAAIEKGKASKWGGNVPRKLTTPLRDGDEKEQEEFHGRRFFNCNCRKAPAVLNRAKAPIMDANEVYSGMWAIVCVNLFPYDSNGNKGVGAGLNAVLKTGDDEAFSGSGSGAHAFDSINVEAEEEGDDLLDM